MHVCIWIKVMVKLLCFIAEMVYNTGDPQVVAHQSTNPAQYCLHNFSIR